MTKEEFFIKYKNINKKIHQAKQEKKKLIDQYLDQLEYKAKDVIEFFDNITGQWIPGWIKKTFINDGGHVEFVVKRFNEDGSKKLNGISSFIFENQIRKISSSTSANLPLPDPHTIE